MLDSYHLHSHNKTTYVDRHIRVDEHRAPTDKSIEILQEMEKKVKTEFIKSFPLESNTFCANVAFFKDLVRDTISVKVTYQINCLFREIDLTVEPYDAGRDDYMQKVVSKAIAKDIAETIVFDSERVIEHLTPSPTPRKGILRSMQDYFSLSYYGWLDPWDYKDSKDVAIKFRIIKGWLSNYRDGRKLKDLLEDEL